MSENNTNRRGVSSSNNSAGVGFDDMSSYRWKARTDTTAGRVCKSTAVENHPLLSRTIPMTAETVKAKAKGKTWKNAAVLGK